MPHVEMDSYNGPLTKLARVAFLHLFVLDLSCVGHSPGITVQTNHATENVSTMVQVQITGTHSNHLQNLRIPYICEIGLKFDEKSCGS